MYSNIEHTQPRSLADIVREKTNDGETIVQFYLDVASGKLDGFRDNHRMAAANKIGKIAPGLVDEYLVRYRNSDCRESLRGQPLLAVRRPPVKWVPPEDRETVPRGPNPFQRRLARIVREETGDGRAIVVFLVRVMHGEVSGFKPHHRLEAADTLAGYVTHGESDDGSTQPALNADEEPAPYSILGPVEGPTANPTVVPAEAGFLPQEPSHTQRGGEGRHSHPGSPEPVLSADEGPVERVEAPVLSTAEEPAPYSIRGPVERVEARNEADEADSNEALQVETPPTKSFPPMTLEELERYNFAPRHFAKYMFARDEITGGIYAFDFLGPAVADEEGDMHLISPDRIIGYERVMHAFRNRDRWPDDVPKPYEDFSSSPPPPRRSRGPIKIWV